MLFGKKINRVLNVRKAEERFEKEREELPLEKGDRLAMILAALAVFIPVLIGVLAVFLLVLYLFFFRFL
ncbi:hypothetical protein B5E65_09270 [Gemmiger sp. An120]|uniref:hypothetical protein n=1 Tax=Gemmiger TaxID=204475 RepID=UPI000B38978C|nr:MULTISPECIES: hypothetical protein [Gemmiger]MBM6915833.1 hypothetical protein [Gemmiger formicilis]OUQ42233.1 hypothetical protein B5E65_09270 [Gemmiger sp. An120]HIX32532.1 hypothetical protein [Candidatus Gemmiger avium]